MKVPVVVRLEGESNLQNVAKRDFIFFFLVADYGEQEIYTSVCQLEFYCVRLLENAVSNR